MSLKTRETHSDQLRRRLEEDIVAGLLQPGTRLDEQTLATRYNVSRTPVREALRQLSATGLLEWRPRYGAIVARPTLDQVVQMFELMAALEELCGRLAARRMSEAERQHLRALHAQSEPLVAGGDMEAYHALNKPFHEAIYRGSHNAYVCEQATVLHNRLAPYRAFQLHQAGRLESSFREHGRIVEAIVGRDGETAAELLRTHVHLHGEALGDLVSRLSAA